MSNLNEQFLNKDQELTALCQYIGIKDQTRDFEYFVNILEISKANTPSDDMILEAYLEFLHIQLSLPFSFISEITEIDVHTLKKCFDDLDSINLEEKYTILARLSRICNLINTLKNQFLEARND